MRRGTTPTVKIAVKGCNLEDFDSIYVTFKQGATIIDKTGDDLEIQDNSISILLSQEDTLKFDSFCKVVEVQMRAVNDAGVAIASNIRQIPIDAILKEGVIT